MKKQYKLTNFIDGDLFQSAVLEAVPPVAYGPQTFQIPISFLPQTRNLSVGSVYDIDIQEVPAKV